MDGPLLVIDRDAAQSIGVQLVEGLRRGILAGDLRPDDPVPSTRALAAELGVSRSAVVAAYEQLAGEGYLEMRQGAPTRVAELVRPDADGGRQPGAVPASDAPSGTVADPQARPRIDLLPGRPSTTRIDGRAWRAAWRHAAALEIPSESPPPFGVAALRDEIADHLRQARGVACAADG